MKSATKLLSNVLSQKRKKTDEASAIFKNILIDLRPKIDLKDLKV